MHFNKTSGNCANLFKKKKKSHNTSHLINVFSCCTTITTCQEPGKNTDGKGANTNNNNWFQQVTKKNEVKQERKYREIQEVRGMDITPGCDVQTEKDGVPILLRKSGFATDSYFSVE